MNRSPIPTVPTAVPQWPISAPCDGQARWLECGTDHHDKVGIRVFEGRKGERVTATTIYKIVASEIWASARDAGSFKGATIDLTDGYIHFSTADQARQTAALHFKGQADLVLVTVSAAALGEALKWEPSRGGDLFPHLYGHLSMDAVIRVDALPLGEDGAHIFPPMDETGESK